MSNDVVPQVDIGALSIKGLAAFTPLLSALSADDVAPLAMVQLENLGSPYHVNGPYARMTPDLLRRYSSVRMDRIGIMIGWRKGDSASFFAQSAGGQAVALMCFCLVNSCKRDDIGSILNDLSEKILPNSLAKSSIAQLTVVADLLASKLQVIGFGNLIAKHVLRLQEAYSHIGKKLPLEFFDSMTRESTVELYHALSRLSSEESTILRISGSYAMAYIMMIVLIMFPDNVAITIDGLITQQGHSPSIFLDICSNRDLRKQPTTIHIEERLNISSLDPILVMVLTRYDGYLTKQCHFKWTGHITDALRIAFAAAGVELPKTLVEACCDVLLCLIQAPSAINSHYIDDYVYTPMPLNGYVDLLGSEPLQRCYHVCQIVFGTTPRAHHRDIRSAYNHLAAELNSVAGPTSRCECGHDETFDLSDGWEPILKRFYLRSGYLCLHCALWKNLVSAISRGYSALLVDAGANATTIFDIAEIDRFTSNLPIIEDVLKANSSGQLQSRFRTCSKVHQLLMSLSSLRVVSPPDLDNVLALSTDSNTIYPASLNDLKVDIDGGFRYNLNEGNLHFKGRRYNRLISINAKTRDLAVEELSKIKGRVRPSYLGEHSHLEFTIRESLNRAELRTTMVAQGHSIQLDLSSILWSYMGMNDAPECPHGPNSDLATELHDEVCNTSVRMPRSSFGKIAIVQTKNNPTAQLLACEPGAGSLLQRRSCLTCAVLYAKKHKLTQIIVAS